MDSNLVTPNYNNEQIPKPIENDYNSNSNAPIPVQNPQYYPPPPGFDNPNAQPQYTPPPGFDNSNLQPQAYPYNPNQPYPYPNRPGAYPYNPNQPYPYNPNQPYPYNPNQPYPYNTNQPYNYPPNPYQQNQFLTCSHKAKRIAFLVMSIIQFLFVVIEIIVLITNGWMGIILIHIDEAAILVVSTLFFLSFLDKCEINNTLRTVLTGAVWFIGFGMRGMADMFINDMRNTLPTLFALMGIRTFILFFSIPVSTLKSEPLNNVS